MGVLGLTPFIQRTCPDIIQTIPNRLKGLAGKRIVILFDSDGTLITQRLHFAPAPHPYRHVLGWYRLAHELKASGVSTICVFDGTERNKAKAEETARRRSIIQLNIARGALENERHARLQKLKSVILFVNAWDVEERTEALNLLKNIQAETSYLRDLFGPDINEERLDGPVENTESSVISLSDTQVPLDKLQDYAQEKEIPSPASRTDIEVADASSKLQDSNFPPQIYIPFSNERITLQNKVNMLESLKQLYWDYKGSISQLDSLPSSTPSSIATPALESLMSKAQSRLTEEEGVLWKDLFQQLESDAHSRILEADSTKGIDELVNKSRIIYESFERRTNTPTPDTYRESKEILKAMGVPCIDSAGSVEAEALAASIVHHGYADYVASEDTDVLVYEAPLLRNITNRQDHLTLVSGVDLRSVLNLDRDAFIDFALLLGTDFSQRIKNIGPARAYKFIKEYGTIERMFASEPEFATRVDMNMYLAQVALARVVFRTLPPVPVDQVLQRQTQCHAQVSQIMQRHGLGFALMKNGELDYSAALAGNYFEDNPCT